MSEIIAYREFTSRSGNLRTTIFDRGEIQLTLWGTVNLTYHLTREDAVRLCRNFEEIVAAYDATCDRYHDVCDEPVIAEVH